MSTNLRQKSDQAALRARAVIVWLIGVLLALLAAACIGAAWAGKAL